MVHTDCLRDALTYRETKQRESHGDCFGNTVFSDVFGSTKAQRILFLLSFRIESRRMKDELKKEQHFPAYLQSHGHDLQCQEQNFQVWSHAEFARKNPWTFRDCGDRIYVHIYVKLANDEYACRTPIPKHALKYTKVKVLHTQDKHTQLSSFAWLCCSPIYINAFLILYYLSEYVDKHSLPTGYLRP